MSSLNETKSRIKSVQSTLKITSAMKLVSSSKLRRAQQAVQAMTPYQERLHAMLALLMTDCNAKIERGELAPGNFAGPFTIRRNPVRRKAVVAMASNTSLCGGFNANVVRELLSNLREAEEEGVEVTVYAVGRKVSEALRRVGIQADPHADLADRPSYAAAAALAEELTEGFLSGRFDRVEIIWNHFVSTATQKLTSALFLPLYDLTDLSGAPEDASSAGADAIRGNFIIEPSPEEELQALLPKVLNINLYTQLLDSSAAEHAARTVAMQTATDNGEDLLGQLTLEYNKGRQSKITSEILDIAGGSMDR